MSNDANIGLSGHKNVKDIQNMVMESTTLYGMSGGFPTQGDIPSVRSKRLFFIYSPREICFYVFDMMIRKK